MNENSKHSDEIESEAAPQWLDWSSEGSEYIRHQTAMQPAAKVPMLKAFAIPAGFNVGTLRRMAEAFLPKKIIVVDHGEGGFEIRRMQDNTNIKHYYEMAGKNTKELAENKGEFVEQDEVFARVINEYFAASGKDLTNYDPRAAEAKKVDCITYAYVQRRIASISCFKRDLQGGTAAIKGAFDRFEASGVLRKLSSEETQDLFKNSAAIYRVNRAALA